MVVSDPQRYANILNITIFAAFPYVPSPLPVMTKKRFLPAALFAAVLLQLFPSCRREAPWRVAEGAVWHTTYRITYQAPVALDDSVMAVMDTVERNLSPFLSSSVISRINQGVTDSVSPMLAELFAVASRVSAASGGRFDPTVSPLVNLWGFGYDKDARARAENGGDDGDFVIPREMIDSALGLVGLGECRIEGGRMVKKHPATSFNFSAVTKGYACDRVAAMLRRNGAENYLVEIGGELAAGGNSPKGRPWLVQIDAPTSETGHDRLTVVKMTHGGMATSGNYRNFHTTERYGRIGHTIDPLTGMPVQTDVASATVIAPTAAEADAWATAAMASRGADALAMIAGVDSVECLLVVAADGGADSLALLRSPGFPKPER